MPGILAALTLVLMLVMVLTRVLLLRSAGTRAVHFGGIDKTDFLIPPFAFFLCPVRRDFRLAERQQRPAFPFRAGRIDEQYRHRVRRYL